LVVTLNQNTMIELNIWIIPVAALIPMVIGFIWYNPKVLGTAWMEAAGMTEEKIQGANMGLIFFLSFLFSCMLAFAMFGLTIHQLGLQSLLLSEPDFAKEGSEIYNYFQHFVEHHGSKHRSFGHGALHGFVGGLFIALPILATNALFERKGWKYILINAGYWIITLTLMGGVVCHFG